MAEREFEKLPDGMFSVDQPISSNADDRDDTLKRGMYAETFARLASGCGTPMVVGLYGTWGVGKTSLMRQIQGILEDGGIPTVWFDPWRHQFDDDPVLALLQKMVADLGMEKADGVKELLTTVSLALSSALLSKVAGLTFGNLKEISETIAKERYRVNKERNRLDKAIKELIDKVREPGQPVVFFIDDLDRCLPDPTLRVLEALKLHLNLEGCVYFLGIDHHVVRTTIKKTLELDDGEQEYLDKIVQVPFVIPRILEETAKDFIDSLLPEDAKSCAEFLFDFLGHNPRQVKRFVNTLSLNILMASGIFKDKNGNPIKPNIELIAVMLLIQQRNEFLWNRISTDRDLYYKLGTDGEDAPKILEEYFKGDTQLQALVQRIDCPRGTPLEKYVNLADVAGASIREPTTTAIEPEMVRIEPGEFWMGSPDGDEGAIASETPRHRVKIKQAFELARYPVTFDEFDAYCDASGRNKPDDAGWGRDRRPVINVSWHDAADYCVWLSKETGANYRLPSEAQWEYACRAGTETRWSFGEIETDFPEYAWFSENFGGNTLPVGTFPANRWGLQDMFGNVWEWVEDVWHDDYNKAPKDGSAWTEGENQRERVLRGGSRGFGPRFARSAVREKLAATSRFNFTGFRVARTL